MPPVFELRQPAREPLHAGKLDDLGARLDRFGPELIGVMEVGSCKPLGRAIRIAMLTVLQVALDDSAESRVEQHAVGKPTEE